MSRPEGRIPRIRARLLSVLLALAALAALLPLPAHAGPVEPGQPLPVLTLKDQFDDDWRIDVQTRLVIFAAGRKASNLVLTVLGPQPKGFLARHLAVYLADMSQMPGFITRTFALPSLREQRFEVGVSLDSATLAGWPRQDDAVTLIYLEQGRVVQHEFVRAEAPLRKALGL